MLLAQIASRDDFDDSSLTLTHQPDLSDSFFQPRERALLERLKKLLTSEPPDPQLPKLKEKIIAKARRRQIILVLSISELLGVLGCWYFYHPSDSLAYSFVVLLVIAGFAALLDFVIRSCGKEDKPWANSILQKAHDEWREDFVKFISENIEKIFDDSEMFKLCYLHKEVIYHIVVGQRVRN